MPDCQVFATTKEEAINNLHELMKNRLQNVEIVIQETETPISNEHPWMKFSGMYEDNPLFDEVVSNIAAYRQELDAEINIEEDEV